MDILTNKANGILAITFNRLEKKNAITAAMYQIIADALKDAETDAEVRVILIAGKQGIFTAGNDLDDFLQNPPQSIDSPVYQFIQNLIHATKPVIAAVTGPAVGIGTTMLLHCDLVYAADNAKFSMPFSKLGLCPEFASSLLLPQIAGYQRAAEKLMLGEAFSAEEACTLGFVNKVLPSGEVLLYAQAQAAKIVELPTSSMRATKLLMKNKLTPAIENQIVEESILFGEMLVSKEAKEAFIAFFEKRKPDFTKFK
ncbi:enoyl-coa hydratase [hydrocarbon metagenome]|uniref:Enoyl-coa hydratase n=1 Tax=hydrocarbon metagenome TaxID=938273 RepID=A0A0W8FPC6_9ZZZZ